MHEKFELTS